MSDASSVVAPGTVPVTVKLQWFVLFCSLVLGIVSVPACLHLPAMLSSGRLLRFFHLFLFITLFDCLLHSSKRKKEMKEHVCTSSFSFSSFCFFHHVSLRYFQFMFGCSIVLAILAVFEFISLFAALAPSILRLFATTNITANMSPTELIFIVVIMIYNLLCLFTTRHSVPFGDLKAMCVGMFCCARCSSDVQIRPASSVPSFSLLYVVHLFWIDLVGHEEVNPYSVSSSSVAHASPAAGNPTVPTRAAVPASSLARTTITVNTTTAGMPAPPSPSSISTTSSSSGAGLGGPGMDSRPRPSISTNQSTVTTSPLTSRQVLQLRRKILWCCIPWKRSCVAV